MQSNESIIQAIRHKFSDGLVEFTQHAVDRSVRRRISLDEIRQAIASGEVAWYWALLGKTARCTSSAAIPNVRC